MTFEEFKALNKESGSHWFSEDTMGFFQSTIHDFNSSNGIFITSECGPFGRGQRMFTIRWADFNTGNVKTVGEFQKFKTLSQAQTRAKKIIIYKEGDE